MTSLYRLSGSGNDFLAVAEREPVLEASTIAALCRRGLSLGADGFFAISRQGRAVRMRYWNADGREAALCLNGTRCAARLALALGWASGEVEIVTRAGPILARTGSRPDEIAVVAPLPTAPPTPVAAELSGSTYAGYRVAIGVPHLVLPWPESLAAAPVAELGAALRHHGAFAPAGTNVNFARFAAPDRLEIRTFERGVEAETLACGTGTLAATAVGLALGRLRLPIRALTLSGFELEVAGEAVAGVPTSWTLAGDARLLARLELTDDAFLPPPAAPRWT